MSPANGVNSTEYGQRMVMELTVVDAFTSAVFSGNPAAVAILDSFPDDSVMQKIAREMNLSETAFVVTRADGDFDLRWFTPTVEVELCGHATLAAAHVLAGPARFQTRSGLLTCTRSDDGWIEMDFPADVPVPAEMPPALDLPDVVWYGLAHWDAVAVFADAALVRELVPDLNGIASAGTRGVIVTAPGDRPGITCVSRVFAPNAGVSEDPVTGSAHCTLAEYWGERLGLSELVGEQASSRGGMVRMRRQHDRVVIAGEAITVATSRFMVP
jgi:predicted PhzF superfamily epimerase YddE/YHI9